MTRLQSAFKYKGSDLACDGIALAELAEQYGTPLFVYSAETLRRNFRRIAKAFKAVKPSLAYSVKANSNGAILRVLGREGAAFDIVAANEMDRVLAAGVSADRIIFAGVGKTAGEMRRALKAGVREFNVESPAEADRLNEVAVAMKRVAPIAIRVNPNVDAKTHRHITTGKKENKFGMSLSAARALAQKVKELPGLRLEGVHAHIGSQILQSTPHSEAARVIDGFLDELRAEGHELKTLNFGGGFGIAYEEEQEPLDLVAVAESLVPLVKKHGLGLILEPGRSIVGPAGALVTKVEYIKHGDERTFVIVDGAMTEVIRPALYDAHHEIVPLRKPAPKADLSSVDIVGPVCETGDFLAKQRMMALPSQGDYLAVLDVGAYCSVMSSTYNSRPRAAEVLIDAGEAHLVRKRETGKDLTRHEVVPSHLK